MTKPKNMTPEQEAAWKEKVAAKKKADRDSFSKWYVAAKLRLKTQECPPVLLALKQNS